MKYIIRHISHGVVRYHYVDAESPLGVTEYIKENFAIKPNVDTFEVYNHNRDFNLQLLAKSYWSSENLHVWKFEE